MATRDNVARVADGDQLDDGYFNEIFEFVFTQTLNNAIAASRTTDDDEKLVYIAEADLDTNADTSNSTCLWKSSADGGVYFVDNVDDFNDASINTSIWTATANTGGDTPGATVTESGSGTTGALNITLDDDGGSPNANVIANGASATDYKALSGDSVILVDFSGEAYDSFFQLSDGSNHVTLFQVADGTRRTFKIVIDKSDESCDYYANADDTVATTSNIDLSTLSNYYLRILCTSGTPAFAETLKIHQVGHLTGAAGSSIYFSDGDTITSASVGLAEMRTTGQSTTYTKELSLNGGTNYTTTNDFAILNATAGTDLRFKVTGAFITSIDGTANVDVPRLNRCIATYK